MYCPNCATQNNDEVKFCRSCGANLSLVPQALTGKLSEDRQTRRHGHKGHGGPPNIGDGIQKTIMGVGFLLVAAAVMLFMPGGRGWGFWLLIPAFGLLAKGIADIVSFKYTEATAQTTGPVAVPPAQKIGDLPPRNTGPVIPPPSVTEGTTRHLDPAAERYNEKR